MNQAKAPSKVNIYQTILSVANGSSFGQGDAVVTNPLIGEKKKMKSKLGVDAPWSFKPPTSSPNTFKNGKGQIQSSQQLISSADKAPEQSVPKTKTENKNLFKTFWSDEPLGKEMINTIDTDKAKTKRKVDPNPQVINSILAMPLSSKFSKLPLKTNPTLFRKKSSKQSLSHSQVGNPGGEQIKNIGVSNENKSFLIQSPEKKRRHFELSEGFNESNNYQSFVDYLLSVQQEDTRLKIRENRAKFNQKTQLPNFITNQTVQMLRTLDGARFVEMQPKTVNNHHQKLGVCNEIQHMFATDSDPHMPFDNKKSQERQGKVSDNERIRYLSADCHSYHQRESMLLNNFSKTISNLNRSQHLTDQLADDGVSLEQLHNNFPELEVEHSVILNSENQEGSAEQERVSGTLLQAIHHRDDIQNINDYSRAEFQPHPMIVKFIDLSSTECYQFEDQKAIFSYCTQLQALLSDLQNCYKEGEQHNQFLLPATKLETDQTKLNFLQKVIQAYNYLMTPRMAQDDQTINYMQVYEQYVQITSIGEEDKRNRRVLNRKLLQVNEIVSQRIQELCICCDIILHKNQIEQWLISPSMTIFQNNYHGCIEGVSWIQWVRLLIQTYKMYDDKFCCDQSDSQI